MAFFFHYRALLSAMLHADEGMSLYLMKKERLKSMVTAPAKGKEKKEERNPIEMLADGKMRFHVPKLVRHMTEPDRVTILQWHIKPGDIVPTGAELVHFEFLEDDWHILMPELEGGPWRMVSVEAQEGQIVHLHDALVLWERVEPSSS